MPWRLTSPVVKLSENDVEQACIDLLRYRGYWVIRQHVGRFKTPDNRWITIGETGDPDYATLHRRYPGFFLEVKRPGNSASPGQLHRASILRQGYGIPTVTVDGVEGLAAWLNRHEKSSV